MSLWDILAVVLIVILAPAAALSLAVTFVAFEAMLEDRKREKDMKKRREAWRKDRK